MDISWNIVWSHGIMGSWDRMDSGTHMQGLSYGPMGSWDGRGIHTQLREGQLDIPWNVPWDRGMGSGIRTQLREGQLDIPWNVPRSHGAVGWDGLCDTHISERRTVGHPVECPMGLCDGMNCWTYTHLRERQVHILWNVLWSHGIVGWDGQWHTHASMRGTGGHPMECPMVPWDGMDSGTHMHLQ